MKKKSNAGVAKAKVNEPRAVHSVNETTTTAAHTTKNAGSDAVLRAEDVIPDVTNATNATKHSVADAVHKAENAGA